MRVLAIETSGDLGSVAVSIDGKLGAEVTFSAAMRHGEKLFDAIDAVLKLSDVMREELELISVATGPGSFTGLRIGVSSAKGLAQGLGVPITGIPSAEGFRSRISDPTRNLAVIFPDRMQWMYVTQYQGKDAPNGAEVLSLEEFLESLTSEDSQALHLGPAVEIHRELFEEHELKLAESSMNQPSAYEIAKLAGTKFNASGIDELKSIEPIYLQPPLATARDSKKKNS